MCSSDLTASFALLAIPQFFHIGTSVTNDTSTTVLGFAVTWLTARALRRGLATRGAVALGAVLGLAMFTKGLALVLVPAVAVAMLLLPATAWRARLLRLVTVGGTALVAGGWWWFANLIRFGNLQPSGMVRGGAKEHDDGLIEFIARIPKQAMQTFWARYGYLDIAIPYYEALGLTAALALMVLIGVIIVRRGWRMSAVMVFLLVTVMVSWLGRVYIFFMKYHGTAGLQGRYVYVAVAAALALAAAPAALVWWRGAFARAFTTMTIVGATALSLYGLDMALSGFYAPPPGSSDTAYDLWSRWSPLGDATLGTSWVLVGFAVAAALAAIVVAWRVRLDPVQTPVAATEQEGVPA